MASQYRWDDYLLDVDNFRLERNGTPLSLEPKALNLLVFLLDRQGRLVTKQELFEGVWPDTAVTDHALTRVVAQLRRVLRDEARDARYIETVPTRGYRWIRPLQGRGPGGEHALDTAVPALAVGLSRRVFRAVMFILTVSITALVGYSLREVATSATARPADTAMSPPVMKADDVKWPVQLTTRNGLELQPALSPLGDALAYVSDRTGALEIYIRALTGVAIDRPLTSDGGQNVQPAWSPNGRFIAYHSSARGGIWLMATHGGVARQIVPQGSRPAWSPDGSSLVFQSDEHTDVTPSGWGAQAGSTLWQVEFTGSGLKQLTFAGRPAGGHAAPVWSPDGRFVAFTVFDSRRDNGVWLVERDTGATRVLARGERLYELAVVPDGSAIYASGGEAFIMRLPLDSVTGTLSGPSAVIPVGGVPGVRGLSMAADGKTLAFAGVALSSHIWAQALTRDGEAAGPPRAMTSDTSRRNSLPILSPDGSKIAYISTRGGATPDLWLMNADGGNAHPLAVNDPLELRFALKRWLPDSRRLAYVSSRNGVLSVRSLDVTTGREDMLFSYGPQEEAATEHRLRGSLAEMHLSPSVTRVAFSLLIPADGRKRVYVSGLDTIQPRLLADGHESVGYPAWSPDERTLAVELKDGSSTHAAVIDVATGVLRRLTNVRGHTWVRSWSPDGRKVAAAVLRDGRWSLRAFDVTDGHETTIIPALPPHVYVRYPEWSRQSDLMVFERGELRGNIWTMSIR